MQLLSLKKAVQFDGLYDQDQFIGLTYTAVDEKAVYLFYLAIEPDKRGHGYGSQVLTLLKERYPAKQIFLDIEPVTSEADNYEQRQKRLAFYQQNGFNLTKHRLIDDGGIYDICTTGSHVNLQELNKLTRKMNIFAQSKIV